MSSIDYNLKQIKGIAFDVDGVLSPSTIPVDDYGNPLRMVNIKDGYAIQLAVKSYLDIAIITGAKVNSVRERYHNLGVKDVYINASMKLPLLLQWMEEKGLKPEEVAYVGDDIPDIPCMRHVGLPCSPADAAFEVKNISRYVSHFNGGYGVGRDILEQIMRAKGLWMTESNAFGW